MKTMGKALIPDGERQVATPAVPWPSLGKDGQENLVSFLIVSCGDADRDLAELQDVADYVQDKFDFYEIIYVLGTESRQSIEHLFDRMAHIGNLRIIVLHMPVEYDDMLVQGLTASIGDYVVAMSAGGLSANQLDSVLAPCVTGRHDLVRVLRAGEQSLAERLRTKALRVALKALVGRPVEPLQSRALCISRAALAKLMAYPGTMQHFRLIDMSDLFNERHVWIANPGSRFEMREAIRRARLVAQLVSLRTPEVLTTLSLVMLLFSVVSALFGVYALGVWLFREDVAEGWTSTSLLLSFMATALLATLSAICLGIVQILRTNRQNSDLVVSQELSNTDLFSKSQRLNVDIEYKV
jgi:hypothetical protein